MEEKVNITQDVEYIKVSRGTRGGYSWDIKIIGLDISKIKRVNDEMQKEFGEMLKTPEAE